MAEAAAKKPRTKKADKPVEGKKYELVKDDFILDWRGIKLFRIRALVAIGLHVAVGDLGGYVEKEENLAQVYGNAWVSGNAWVYGDARVSPICISGLTWHVTIADDQMTIGCQSHSLVEWWAFDDRAIERMDTTQALDFWALHKPYLQAICTATGRPMVSQSRETEAA